MIWRSRTRTGKRGQAVVELALLLPVYMLLLLGMLEFGLAFDHLLSISYSTREGARVGAALTNGGGTLGCGSGQSLNAATVDPQIVAAVERILTSSGSIVNLQDVSQIRIYLATATGGETVGKVNVWTYSAGGGPVVDGSPLDFVASSSPWTACSRTNALPAASIGVSVVYTYRFSTPIGGILAIIGGSQSTSLPITDKTLMAMNPTK